MPSFEGWSQLRLLLLSIYLFVFSSLPVTASARCIKEHHDSLLLLKSQLSFYFEDNQLAYWVPGTDCCGWPGVSCLDKSGEVTGLNISTAEARGELHSALFNLTSLQILDLSYNRFDGSIPSEFDRLVNLRILNLFATGFVGQIPVAISHLTKLVYLNLGNNEALSLEDPDLSTLVMDMNQLEQLRLEALNISMDGSDLYPLFFNSTPKLQVLDLSSCSVSGTVPAPLFTHPSLWALVLSDNSLSAIPEDVTDAESSVLKILKLDSNGLRGKFPPWLFKLSHLQVLDLGFNGLTGSVYLSSFSLFRNLTVLRLSINSLTVHTDQPIPQMPHLQRLALASCNLTKFPQFLIHPEGLRSLNLSHNSIDGLIPSWIWPSVSVTTSNSTGWRYFSLDLSFNQLNGYEMSPSHNLLPASSGGLVCRIFLKSNNLEGPILVPPCELDTILDYSYNSFTHPIPSNIGEYTKEASIIQFSRNSLTGKIPLSLCDASASLNVLDLSHNQLIGSLPACLGNMARLRVLNLKGNKFSGKFTLDFSNGCGLFSINLNDNMFEGELPTSLASCMFLTAVDVGNNKFRGQFLFWMEDNHRLTYLMLGNNELTGTLDHDWTDTFNSLIVIDLSGNQFKGRVPHDMLRNLQAMKMPFDFPTFLTLNNDMFNVYREFFTITIKNSTMDFFGVHSRTASFDLSCNGFEGNIPIEIGDLILLKSLNFSHNRFTGPIPKSLKKLKQLESLDLSYNMVSGEIPTELTSLTFLSIMNLSYNLLTGRIPRGMQFNTFTIFSYIGNTGLCGSPLSHLCEQENWNHINEQNFNLDEKPKGVDWHLMSMEFGFIAGIMLWVGIIIFWPNGRRSFNENIDKARERIGVCLAN